MSFTASVVSHLVMVLGLVGLVATLGGLIFAFICALVRRDYDKAVKGRFKV